MDTNVNHSKYTDYKYNFLFIWNERLTGTEKNLLATKMTRMLNVSERTWKDWMYIKKNQTQQLGTETIDKVIAIINQFTHLNLNYSDLINYSVNLSQSKID